MLIGYARVSTTDQTLDLQKDALEKAGCTKIFTDTASGAKAERIGLDEALSYVRPGDTLVVWRLDRLGRSLPHLIETIKGLADRGIGFKSITEAIDTTTSGGKLIFHIFGALAEFERDIIRERTQAGLTAARARGRKGGRPKALTPKKKIAFMKLTREAQSDAMATSKSLKLLTDLASNSASVSGVPIARRFIFLIDCSRTRLHKGEIITKYMAVICGRYRYHSPLIAI